MRGLWTLFLAAGLGLALLGARVSASEGFDDIAKLAKSGVEPDVLLAFVQASPIAYDLSVDEILYLNDVGVNSKMIQEIMNHGKDVKAGKDPVVAAVPDNPPPADPVGLAPQDDNTQDPVDPATLVGFNQPGDPNAAPVAQDPNADNAPVYISPLTGEVSTTPEVIQATEVVHDTVSVSTPVAECAECTTSHFYEALTPYGTWVNINGTWCWQPSVGCSDPEWRPYGNRGHWVWSDSGWCWESDYSWGWAPFHYGRWWRAPGYGWMWTPDTVWGPAWVNWRQSESHWGWAPLPPAARFETDAALGVGFHFGGRHWGANVGVGFDFGLSQRDYCFVAQEHFCEHNVYSHFVPRDQLTIVFRNTTIIQNNISYNGNSHNVFVHGPDSHRVELRINRPLVQIRLEDRSIQAGATLSRGSGKEENGVLRFYRPKFTAVAVETPHEVAVRQIAHVSVNTRPVADARILAASARADELRERQLAVQDAHRETVKIRQSAAVEEATAKHAEFEQHRLNTLLTTENNQERKAELNAKLAAERQHLEEARQQKVALDKQAAEQRKHAAELALERDRLARTKATADAEALRRAQEAKDRMATERAEREKAERDAAALRGKALEDQRARAAAAKANTKNDAEAKALAAEADRKAKLDADRAARAANQKAQADIAAKQKAQMEADRAARLKPNVDVPVNPNVPKVNPNVPKVVDPNVPRVDPNKGAAERAAAERAAREAAAEKAAAERAAAIKAEREKPKTLVPPGNTTAPNWQVNPKTGKRYDANNPNDPNFPRK